MIKKIESQKCAMVTEQGWGTIDISRYNQCNVNKKGAIRSSFGKSRDLKPACEEDIMTEVYVLSHYNLKQGLKLYSERGKKVTKTSLHKFISMEALMPIDSETLEEEKRKSIAYLIFLKEKKRWNNQGKTMCW